MNEFLEILARFGDGRDNPADTVVRFLLPSLFWSILAFIAFKQWRQERSRKDLYVWAAALVGLGRELFMFTAEYGSSRGLISFNSIFRYYPPLEHAATMLAGVLMGYAFMRYFLEWRRFPPVFLIAGSAVTSALYILTAILWPAYLYAHPGTLFGAFWGDMAFRVSASVFMAAVLGSLVAGTRQGKSIPRALYVGFLFFFLDEFMMIFNLMTAEVARTTFAPIRHNLHIWAIPFFLNVYWTEMYRRKRRAEEALRESEQNFRALAENASEGILIVMADGSFVYANTRAAEITGYTVDELRSVTLRELAHPDEVVMLAERLTNRLKGESLARYVETRIVRKNGEDLPIEVSGARTVWHGSPADLVIFRDIADRLKREEELLRVEKLESLGVLAGGLAHDFNNLLTAIMGNIDLARAHTTAGNEFHDLLEQAERASLRARDITRQLLTFARGGTPVKKVISLGSVIRDSAEFALRGANVRCDFSIPGDLLPVDADEGQISQVVNNLIINADQAMPEGGLIHVRAENVILGDGEVIGLDAGPAIRISIQDQGIGISREHQEKIFDPYFTTKQKGSGLGLATAFSILKKHGGHITLVSELRKGAAFHLYLPASRNQVTEKVLVRKCPVPGKGRVLIMDDEEIVRKIAGAILSAAGYETAFARDGAEAIAMYRRAMRSQGRFDAVIMDLTVPGGVGGKEAVRTLREIDQGVKALVSSGYSDDPIMADFEAYGFSGGISKPYTSSQLTAAIHKILGR